MQVTPIYDKDGELHHINNTGSGELTINSLRGQYRTELELLSLLNFISTLEKLELI